MLFPAPFTTKLLVRGKKAEISITNELGKRGSGGES